MIDGRQHRLPKHVLADRARDERIAAAGYRVIRLQAMEIQTHPERVLKRIARQI